MAAVILTENPFANINLYLKDLEKPEKGPLKARFGHFGHVPKYHQVSRQFKDLGCSLLFALHMIFFLVDNNSCIIQTSSK